MVFNGGAMVFNGGAVAVDSQRREPLDIVAKRTGESRSDGISAVTPQDSHSGSMMLSAMVHIPLAADALGTKSGGSRRRQGAAVPIGTKKVVEFVGDGVSPTAEPLLYV